MRGIIEPIDIERARPWERQKRIEAERRMREKVRRKGLGYNNGGRCHIDGQPCPRAKDCAESPYMACENCGAKNHETGYACEGQCAICAERRGGKCYGFVCLLTRRIGGKSVFVKGEK